MTLDEQQRQHLADKLMDSANYALAGLVFGQFVTRTFHWSLAVTGLAIYGVLLVVTTLLRRRR